MTFHNLVPLCVGMLASIQGVGRPRRPTAGAMVAAARGAALYAPQGDTLPSSVAGTWDVTRVAVDGQDQMHQLYRKDDPRILGHALSINDEGVSFTFDIHFGCKQRQWKSKSATWPHLIGKGLPRPPMGGRKATPTAADFGLELPGKEPALAYVVCPPAKPEATTAFPLGTWVAPLKDGSLAFHYDPQLLLILARRAPNATPDPSFECPKAGTAVEKTICGNFALAARDRSIAIAYRGALERNARDKARIQGEQREWLKVRDQCGPVAECLEETMERRIEVLVGE
jgi:uncharacterized protein YecT (DUF1311 family)